MASDHPLEESDPWLAERLAEAAERLGEGMTVVLERIEAEHPSKAERRALRQPPLAPQPVGAPARPAGVDVASRSESTSRSTRLTTRARITPPTTQEEPRA